MASARSAARSSPGGRAGSQARPQHRVERACARVGHAERRPERGPRLVAARGAPQHVGELGVQRPRPGVGVGDPAARSPPGPRGRTRSPRRWRTPRSRGHRPAPGSAARGRRPGDRVVPAEHRGDLVQLQLGGRPQAPRRRARAARGGRRAATPGRWPPGSARAGTGRPASARCGGSWCTRSLAHSSSSTGRARHGVGTEASLAQ